MKKRTLGLNPDRYIPYNDRIAAYALASRFNAIHLAGLLLFIA